MLIHAQYLYSLLTLGSPSNCGFVQHNKNAFDKSSCLQMMGMVIVLKIVILTFGPFGGPRSFGISFSARIKG
jgi:hypothetical protein